jgi:hypothetical protein
MGAVVRRRHERPGAQGRRGRGGENLPRGEPSDHALGRSRGGFGSKLHLVCDGRGVPLAVEVSAGQRNECEFAEQVLDAVAIPGARGPAAPPARARSPATRATASARCARGCGGTACAP